MVGVLFVCTGNICRSPTGEGVFRALVEGADLGHRITVDSAGTHAYHVGESPDPRSQVAARARGIDLSGQRARRATADDFRRFEFVLAMDEDNRRLLARLCPRGEEHRLGLLMDFAPDSGPRDVPDPYYGGEHGFERVLDMIEAASQGLLAHIRRDHL